MIQLTCIPLPVRLFLAGLRESFRYRHFLVFSWLLVLQATHPDAGTLKELSRRGPRQVAYQHLRRLLCASYWWSKFLLGWFATQAMQALPPPEDGICYLLGDSTYKGKRGQKNPAVKKSRLNAWLPYFFGIQIVFLVVHWHVYRLPVDFEIVRRKDDPRYRKENGLFRQMLEAFVPPDWTRHVIVLADAAYAAKETFKLIKRRRWFFLMACARTWCFEDGRSLRDLVTHLPYQYFDKVCVDTPNGRRRRCFWVFAKRTRLRHLGDVTVVLSKCRRNHGPQQTKILVTNLPKSVSARTLVTLYQRRWYVELLIAELKSGLGMGQHQVTKQVERVERSIGICVLTYLMLLKLRAQDIPAHGSWSLFQLQRNFAWQVGQEQLERTARHQALQWLRRKEAA